MSSGLCPQAPLPHLCGACAAKQEQRPEGAILVTAPPVPSSQRGAVFLSWAALWKEDVVTGQGPPTDSAFLSVAHLWHNLVTVPFCAVAAVSVRVWELSYVSGEPQMSFSGKSVATWALYLGHLGLCNTGVTKVFSKQGQKVESICRQIANCNSFCVWKDHRGHAALESRAKERRNGHSFSYTVYLYKYLSQDFLRLISINYLDQKMTSNPKSFNKISLGYSLIEFCSIWSHLHWKVKDFSDLVSGFQFKCD